MYEFDFHDLYKYPGYETVRKHMTGRSQSSPANQSGETYRAAPILTGLRKLDKLNCVPFDFYHANLVKCLTRNHKLVIIGYSFGDTYCNQLIDRMNYFHGDKARIVLIDKWNIPPELRRRYGAEFLSHSLGMFLCKAARLSSFYEVMAGLYASPHGNSGPLRSANGHLMVCPDGFRDAATHFSEIDAFLNS